ncbi:type III secretion system protein [Erwinia sp. E602]|uniref:type III secretion system protein n=1 Tax=Erwinia sp. E602 TaxID=2675378 RepID=UPI001BA84214|nr:type III secretion system protein [Erwinia sp. E602]QUG74587.1 type III secretion system protein [Erwinia sp. E602]
MNVWRRGRGFVSLLERKQQMLHSDITQAQNKILQLKASRSQCHQETVEINQKIKNLTPSGVLSKRDIHQGIRQQGILLSHQQLIVLKISQLEEEQYAEELKVERFRAALGLLDKRHYKISDYLHKYHRMHLIRKENNRETEVQEMASHVRKNF